MAEVRLPSEAIEPILADTVELVLDEWERSGRADVDARRFWSKMSALSTLTVVNGAPHATVVLSNYLRMTADLIEDVVGKNPIREGW